MAYIPPLRLVTWQDYPGHTTSSEIIERARARSCVEMGERQKAKKYTAEFKESAVKLAVESKRPLAHIARELGVSKDTSMAGSDSITGSLSRARRRRIRSLFTRSRSGGVGRYRS